jgi:hypothetical protein
MVETADVMFVVWRKMVDVMCLCCQIESNTGRPCDRREY